MIFDYETLKLIWWLLICVLLIGFAVTDGFDMGVGMLLPFLGKTDDERRVIINCVGPVWEGNQTWLITAAGAIFAAWPLVYAAAFSGFYIALLLVLFALFFRPVGFDYRSKLPNPVWRSAWDWALCVGSTVPAVIFGVAIGNLFLGVPFHFDHELRVFYTGSFWQLLNPFGLLVGLLSLSMLLMHGAIYLQLRTDRALQARARRVVMCSTVAVMMLFVLAGIWVANGIEGYRIAGAIDGNAFSNPFAKSVEKINGGWLENYSISPWMLTAPLAGLGGALLTTALSFTNKPGIGLVTSGIGVAGIILTAAFSMFPFIMPSSSIPGNSLTLWDAASSHRTLQTMFWATVIFLPIIIAYASWAYRVMRGTITVQSIRDNTHTAY